ncbi:MAG: AbrB/MazE/SpoVT family DNA-binding domain-containing protein [Burkholderiales bacterium]|nr:AbrB/MazE/SpoVT family DNA-binding domain-containing protein [Burkholderiales bacterium]
MNDTRIISLFRNGRNQAVRIPREFELEGDQATIRKEGNCLIIEALPLKNPLLGLLTTLVPIEEEFPTIEELPLLDEEIF